MSKQITITIDTNLDALFANDLSDMPHDVTASAESYEKMVLAAVQAEYPDAEIDIKLAHGKSDICIEENGEQIDDDFETNAIGDLVYSVWETFSWVVEDDGKIALIEQYKKLGREIAETEEYQNSEDAWESNEEHYSLTEDEKEIAADAFGDGFISYIPPVLNEVLTSGEACEMFKLAEATVRQAINRGQIFARKSGGTWIIRRKDAVQKWGETK